VGDDRTEFDRFVREHAQAVRRYALSLTRDPWTADDVLQETFLRAWKYWPTFRGTSTREAWVIRICRNVAFDLLASRVAHVTLDEERICDDRVARLNSPLLSLDVVGEMMQLGLEHREVVFLVDVLEYDYETAAEILEIPVGTVRSRVHRARALLRTSIEQGNEKTA
jgi:RNA polymerase sigma-70 factor (ECF subfamily)